MKSIKQAIIYRAELPSNELLAGHLAEFAHRKILPTEILNAGFVVNPLTNELVSDFPGGRHVRVRIDEKVLPSAAVKEAARERTEEYRRMIGAETVTRKVRQQIHDDTVIELAKTALVRCHFVDAYHLEKQDLLIVATTSPGHAAALTRQLVMAVGSVKTTSIHISNIKHGLTARLRDHLDGNDDAFESHLFQLGGQVKLIRDGGDRVSYNLGELEQSKDGIIDLLTQGFEVDQLGLIHSGVEFNVTSKFHLKGIDFVEDEDEQQDDVDDPVHAWRTRAGAESFLLGNVVEAMCGMLEYKDSDADQGATEQEG